MKTKQTAAFAIGYANGDPAIYPGGEVVYEGDTIIFVGSTTTPRRLTARSTPTWRSSAPALSISTRWPTSTTPSWTAGTRPKSIGACTGPSATSRQARRDLFTPEEEALKRRYALIQLILNGITTAMPIAAETTKGWCETYDEFVEVAAIAAELGLRM